MPDYSYLYKHLSGVLNLMLSRKSTPNFQSWTYEVILQLLHNCLFVKLTTSRLHLTELHSQNIFSPRRESKPRSDRKIQTIQLTLAVKLEWTRWGSPHPHSPE